MSQSIPKVWATEIVMSGTESLAAGERVWVGISRLSVRVGRGVVSDHGTAFQCAIGEIDAFQAFFRQFVPAIGIWMKQFRQGLVTPLDLLDRRSWGEVEFGKRQFRLALGRGRGR